MGTSFGDDAQRTLGRDWQPDRGDHATLRRPTSGGTRTVLVTAWIHELRGERADGAVIDGVLRSARQAASTVRCAAPANDPVPGRAGPPDEARTLLHELEADWRAAIALPSAEWVSAAAHAAYLLGPQVSQEVAAMLKVSPRMTPWVEAALATVLGDHDAAAVRYGHIGALSDRALSLAWAARDGGAAPEELTDFIARNGAVRLPSPA
jgi:hypothetical protein